MSFTRRLNNRSAFSRLGCGCFGIPSSSVWLFFTLMYFFTDDGAIPAAKWEFVWRFFAGPFNFLF